MESCLKHYTQAWTTHHHREPRRVYTRICYSDFSLKAETAIVHFQNRLLKTLGNFGFDSQNLTPADCYQYGPDTNREIVVPKRCLAYTGEKSFRTMQKSDVFIEF